MATVKRQLTGWAVGMDGGKKAETEGRGGEMRVFHLLIPSDQRLALVVDLLLLCDRCEVRAQAGGRGQSVAGPGCKPLTIPQSLVL